MKKTIADNVGKFVMDPIWTLFHDLIGNSVQSSSYNSARDSIRVSVWNSVGTGIKWNVFGKASDSIQRLNKEDDN